MLLKDKVAVATGAGSGLGRATAQAMAREGAAVVLTGRNASEGENAGVESPACPMHEMDLAPVKAAFDIKRLRHPSLHEA